MRFDLLHTPLDLSLGIALTNWTGSNGAVTHWRVDSEGKEGSTRLLLGRGDDDQLPGFNRFLVPGKAEDLLPWVQRWLGQARMGDEPKGHPDGGHRVSHRLYNFTEKGPHEDALASSYVVVAIEPVWEYVGK